MKLSLKWLSEYVDIKEFLSKPEELARRLTSAGIEVDSLENKARDFQNVVTGQIVELGRHPNADRLTLCKVDVGDLGPLKQIVCGAKNHKQGDKVVVALPGAVLPGNFEIKLSKIRDVESQGMLASESELGLKKESEGILILPSDTKPGQSFADFYGLDDVILELSVTPNRADCLSHLGLAREIACLLGRPYQLPDAQVNGRGESSKAAIKLTVSQEKVCPRYAGRVIRGVKIGPSPRWLAQRLEAVDIKPINNIVDITNYVMLELGQPLHAFDLARVKGGEIRVDLAKAGEKFVTLDGTELSLKGFELMIRDQAGPVALAGVVGGKNSGVEDTTQDLFIESAHFVPETVRRTARAWGIETDSAYRFSRGTDPEMVLFALNRASQLMCELAGGTAASEHLDFYPHPAKAEAIKVRLDYVSERLGYKVLAESFNSFMKRLGCQVNSQGQEFVVTPPIFRWDLRAEIDLVEEFGRLNGYEHIPESLPGSDSAPSSLDLRFWQEERLSSLLAHEGYHQCVNYGFVSSRWQKSFLGQVDRLRALGLEAAVNPVTLRNPLNEELDVMRVSLLPGLMSGALRNIRYGNASGRTFECGSVFSADGGFSESLNLGLLAWGQESGLWQKSENRPVVYDLKSALENLLEALNLTGFQWKTLDASTAPNFLHPGQSVGLFVEGRLLGYLGSLHPAKAAEEKLRVDVAMAELDVMKLMRGQPKPAKLKALSSYQAVDRDIAVVISKDLAAGELCKEIAKVGGELIRNVRIFDVFEGAGVPEGQRSVAYRYRVQDATTTLSEEQLKDLQERILKALSTKFAAKTR